MADSEESSNEDSYRSGCQTWDGEDGFEGRLYGKKGGRACDLCRRKKIKCECLDTTDRRCTNCVASGSQCTYGDPTKRNLALRPAYVQKLKNRIRKLEGILSELFPHANVKAQNLTAEELRRSCVVPRTSLTPYTAPNEPTSSASNQQKLSSDGDGDELESEHPYWLLGHRFHGQSSGVMFYIEAVKMKLESTDAKVDPLDPRDFSQHNAGLSVIADTHFSGDANDFLTWGPTPKFTFPPEDLMDSLVALFFEKTAVLLPIFHRPTFIAQYRSQLHMKDLDFATNLLLACAVASRYSEDIRVLPANRQILLKDDSERWFYAGLDYYLQVQHLLGHALTKAPSLADLEKCALACLYLLGSKTAPQGWSLSGFGLRLALEAGAHRKRNGAPLTIESQRWNRAFWCLIILDRLGAASTGRPCALYDEEIDVDLPVAVDDEYWDPPDPKDAWKQPTGKPAIAEHFRAILKLLEILAFTLRTVYSSNKSKQLLGLVGPSWEQRVVSEIDSTLNKWIDSIPDHLRWNPHQENPVFFDQSALLHCLYYHIQILAHRPFILITTPSSSLSFPSLAICTNAARSTSHILEIHIRKGSTAVGMVNAAFSSGVVLLLNIWGVKKLGIRAAPERHLQDVFNCMAHLKAHSKRWAAAKLAWDSLNELLSAGDFPRPQPSPPSSVLAGVKRRHEDVRGATSGSPTSTLATAEALTQEAFSPLTRAVGDEETSLPSDPVLSHRAPGPWQTADATQIHLPFTREDLGLLPLHPELYYTSGPIQSNIQNADQNHICASSINSAEGFNMSNDSTNISFGWPEAEHASFMGPGTTMSSGTGCAQQEQTLAPIGDVTRPLYADSETSLGQDTLSMWATAPPSFGVQDWGDFAQDFQLGEQLGHTDIFSDGAA